LAPSLPISPCNGVVVPCWFSSCMCSTTYSTPSTNSLCLLVSSTIIYVSYWEIFYTCYSTSKFGVFCPSPFKLCGSSSCCSYATPLHSTSSTSYTRLDGFELFGLQYIKARKAFLKHWCLAQHMVNFEIQPLSCESCVTNFLPCISKRH
jgi:hypothetical protein